jgi:hypothetical protein
MQTIQNEKDEEAFSSVNHSRSNLSSRAQVRVKTTKSKKLVISDSSPGNNLNNNASLPPTPPLLNGKVNNTNLLNKQVASFKKQLNHLHG